TVSPNLGAPDINNLNMEFSPDDAVVGGLDTSLDNSNATPLLISTPPLTTTGSARPRPLSPNITPTTVRPGAIQFRFSPRQSKTEILPKTTTIPSTSATTFKSKIRDLKTSSPVKPLDLPVDPAISAHDAVHNLFSKPGPYPSPGSGPPPNSWLQGSQGVKNLPGGQGQQPPEGQTPRNIPWWWLLMEEV
ncbi:unnamed protein product, partial [Candidula unifasciata]